MYPNARRGFTYHWLPSPAFCTGRLFCNPLAGRGVFLAISQTKPANSRAIAAITRGCGFLARLRWRYRLHRRVCAFQPISLICCGRCSDRLRYGCPSFGGCLYDHPASTSIVRANALPVLVSRPRRMLDPLGCSLKRFDFRCGLEPDIRPNADNAPS